MLIREVDRKLDMMCTIAITQDTPWFGLTSGSGSVIPGYLYREDEHTFLQMYISKTSLSKGLQTAIRTHGSVVEKKSYYTVSEKISDVKQMTYLAEIMKVPSVITTNSYLLGKELFITFRFHSIFNSRVNRALSAISGSEVESRIDYFGPSPGITRLLENFNADNPVSVVRYTVDLPGSSEIVERALKRDREGIAELDPRNQTMDTSRLILYSNSRIGEGMTPVSHDDMIYESEIHERFIVESTKLGNEFRIPRIAFFVRIRGNRLEDTTFIPTVEADEYLKVLFSIQSEDDSRSPELELYSPFNSDMWKWL